LLFGAWCLEFNDSDMRVLIACGASGGHIFPALSFAERLKAKKEGIEILFLSTRKGPGEILLKGYNVKLISVVPLKFLSLRFFPSLCLLFKSMFEVMDILRVFRPDLVVGFGGYSSVPAVLLAALSGKRTLIHEQNVSPGRATCLLAPLVNKIAIGFQETKRYFNLSQKRKLIFTGNPLRSELFGNDRKEALRFFNLDFNKKTVLVMGGSQGSQKINRVFVQTALLLKDSLSFQVIHICGRAEEESLRRQYDKFNIEARVFGFLKEMGFAYSAADVVISRAGALTISEIIALCKPSILIPYPFAKGHQMANANLLLSRNAAIVIRDADLCAEFLKYRLLSLFKEQAEVDTLRKNLSHFTLRGADGLLAEAALGLMK